MAQISFPLFEKEALLKAGVSSIVLKNRLREASNDRLIATKENEKIKWLTG